MKQKTMFHSFRAWFLSVHPMVFSRREEEHFLTSLKEEVQREFYYVNLNSNESIFLFAEKYTDYHVVVEKMYRFFAYRFDSECYFAVSKEIEDKKESGRGV